MAAAADAEADELIVAAAADIICSMRGADLAGWTPPWRKAEPEPEQASAREGELIWPAVARGKRSRRRSPSAGSSGGGKARWGRASPASPLDYSGGSGSGSGSAASTSGGEDVGGGFSSLLAHHHRPVPATKVGATERTQQLNFPTTVPRPTGQRPRKKLRLPEIQQLVRSLAVENENLREEMRDLQRACKALSKENDKLETKLGQSNSQNEITSKDKKGKEQLDQQLVTQCARDSFVLPDLNFPPEDSADVPTVH